MQGWDALSENRVRKSITIYERIVGLTRAQAVGQKASELYGTGEPPYLDIYAHVAATQQSAAFETYFPPMYKHFSISVFSPARGRFATVFTDISVRKQMEEALRAMALVDDLTGLYNRRGFLILAQQQLKMADRVKGRMMLLFADLNGLKWINDTFGHPEGDRALIEVADVLRETFRESDISARFGGDEFVVLAIETDNASPEILITRLQENLEARNVRGGRRYKLSLSMGIAHYDPEHPCSIDDLLARADRLMYEQKQVNQKV
jgi:diguanylate cyclase (GGDEF)-like protein